MFYTYVLLSTLDYDFYTGSTSDLERRYQQHQAGLVISTKDRRPLQVVYYEGSLNEADCRKREKYLKSGPGRKYLRYRLRYYLIGLAKESD